MNQSLGAWLGDRGRLFAVSLFMEVLFVVLLYIAIRRLGRRWWIAGAVIGIIFMIAMQALYPVFIAPLVNDFKPLENAALRTDILALAHNGNLSNGIMFPIEKQYDGKKLTIKWAEPFKTGEQRRVVVAYKVIKPIDGLVFSQTKHQTFDLKSLTKTYPA